MEIIKGEISSTCNYCGNASSADGILGTGICLSQECKDRMNQAAASDAALKAAQAAALSALGTAKGSSGISTGAIIAIVFAILLIVGGGAYLLIRKK